MYCIVENRTGSKRFVTKLPWEIARVGDWNKGTRIIFKGTEYECNLMWRESKTILDELSKERLKALWDGIYTDFKKVTNAGVNIIDNTSELTFYQQLLSCVGYNYRYFINIAYRDRLDSSMTFGQMVRIMVAEEMQANFPDFELHYNFQSLLPEDEQ